MNDEELCGWWQKAGENGTNAPLGGRWEDALSIITLAQAERINASVVCTSCHQEGFKGDSVTFKLQEPEPEKRSVGVTFLPPPGRLGLRGR